MSCQFFSSNVFHTIRLEKLEVLTFFVLKLLCMSHILMKGNLIGNLKFDLKEIVFYGLFDNIFIRNFLKNKFQQKKNGLVLRIIIKKFLFIFKNNIFFIKISFLNLFFHKNFIHLQKILKLVVYAIFSMIP